MNKLIPSRCDIPSRCNYTQDERGAGTIFALGIMFTAITVLTGLGTMCKVLLDRQQLQNSTDNAALVAADTLLGFVDGNVCSNATAHLKQGTINSCEIGETEVNLKAQAPTLLGITLFTSSRAGLPAEH